MGEHEIVRGVLLRIGREVPGTAPLAKAVLGWARPHARWLIGERAGRARLGWSELRAALAGTVCGEPEARPLAVAARLAEALCLGEEDTRVLRAAVAFGRCPRARALAHLLGEQEADMSLLLAHYAGIEPHALRRSQAIRLGLVELRTRRGGGVEVDTGWTLERLLDRGAASAEELLAAVVGPRQQARLAAAHFPGKERDIGFLVRLIGGAVRARAPGVNILLHGAPGTGKTELARTLAAAADIALYSVGEADEDGDEPSRGDRVNALRLAHRMLGERGGACLLFDEMEDLIGDAERGRDDRVKGRQGSKLWVNRMLETNPVPVIWTTNAIGNVDPAILRRMSYVLRFDLPSPAAAAAMLDRIARDEGAELPESVRALVGAAPEAATVLRVAARAGQLAGEPEAIGRAAESLVMALRGGEPLPQRDGPVDLDLYEADADIAALFARIAAPGAPADVSLLLTGPPGTGKTGLAHQLARSLDRPLLVRRASDLLSKWVGGTEANIADAFREAERQGGVLLFDEADSLLFDRSTRARELGSEPGQRAAHLARPASLALRRGDQPRGPARSGGDAALRVQARAGAARPRAGGARVRAFLRHGRARPAGRGGEPYAGRLRGGPPPAPLRGRGGSGGDRRTVARRSRGQAGRGGRIGF